MINTCALTRKDCKILTYLFHVVSITSQEAHWHRATGSSATEPRYLTGLAGFVEASTAAASLSARLSESSIELKAPLARVRSECREPRWYDLVRVSGATGDIDQRDQDHEVSQVPSYGESFWKGST